MFLVCLRLAVRGGDLFNLNLIGEAEELVEEFLSSAS